MMPPSQSIRLFLERFARGSADFASPAASAPAKTAGKRKSKEVSNQEKWCSAASAGSLFLEFLRRSLGSDCGAHYIEGSSLPANFPQSSP
jgi:hypothetical protein